MARPLPPILRAVWPAAAAEPPAAAVEAIGRAVEVLSRRGLVAIPTETVYGLAADACGSTRLDRDLLIHVARLGGGSWLVDLWRNSGGRSRLTLVRWVLAPDRAYIARVDGGPRRTLLLKLMRHWRRLGADLAIGARQWPAEG
jgi:hypothetical protein